MGIKYKIIRELGKAENGLTISELSKLLGKSKNVLRAVLNRDLKPKYVVELETHGMVAKRDGNKIYVLPKDEKGNVRDIEYLRKLHSIMKQRFTWKEMPTEEEVKDLQDIENVLNIERESEEVE